MKIHAAVENLNDNEGDKAFTCEECDVICLSTAELTTHKRVHDVEKPHLCRRCNYRFATSSELTYHVIETHTGNISLKCKFCPETFVLASELKIHMQFHAVETDEQYEDMIDLTCLDKPYVDIDEGSQSPVPSAEGTSVKLFKVTDLKEVRDLYVPDGSFLASIVDHSLKLGRTNTQLTKYYKKFSDIEKMSVNHLIITFFKDVPSEDATANSFFEFCKTKINVDICKQAEVNTRLQAESALWHELKYGRVTASKAYPVMCCQTDEDTLVDSLLGESFRGSSSKTKVLGEIEKLTGMKFQQCGLMVLAEHPIIAATPDAVSDDYIVEVKCPTSEKPLETYFKQGEIAARYMTQVQLQMHAFGKEKALFCVAHENFEKNKIVNLIITVSYDRNYCENMAEKCEDFWAKSVFALLKKNYSY